ncbi:unnamed protein product [Symbiodinium sp. CCMP2592]|nr:unnamed protein product [Symbiodinium sp. CCMP2592]
MTKGVLLVIVSSLTLRRSHSEAQEAAQHLGGLHMPQGILQLGVGSSVATPVSRILTYSVGEDNMIVKYSERLTAQFLLEARGYRRIDWKTGNNLVGAPSFQPDPPTTTDSEGPADPTFNLCSLTRNPEGNLAIALPPGIRTKWSEDSARKEDWRHSWQSSMLRRNANVTLKITSAVEKNQEQAVNVCEGQLNKLFLVPNLEVVQSLIMKSRAYV